jgi:predicted secreted acid phosphatase
MFTWIIGIGRFLANPKRLLFTLLGVASMAVLWYTVSFVNTAIDNAKLVEQQRIEILFQQNEIKTQNVLLQQEREAAAIAERARQEAEVRLESLQDIQDTILQSGEEADAPIAPVLQDTLRALRD